MAAALAAVIAVHAVTFTSPVAEVENDDNKDEEDNKKEEEEEDEQEGEEENILATLI